jgi:hypothetical protein
LWLSTDGIAAEGGRQVSVSQMLVFRTRQVPFFMSFMFFMVHRSIPDSADRIDCRP